MSVFSIEMKSYAMSESHIGLQVKACQGVRRKSYSSAIVWIRCHSDTTALWYLGLKASMFFWKESR